MNDVLKVFFSLSISGSLLILALFICRHFLKDKVSRQWQYYIWLIVIARLLLPLAPEINLMGYLFQATSHVGMPQAGTALPQQAGDEAHASGMGKEAQEEIRQPVQPVNQPMQDIISVLGNQIWLVWLAVAFMLLIRKITVYQSFVRYIKAGEIPISDTSLLDRLAVIGKQAGVKRPVELCVNPLISSPMLTGFFCPCIVLPDAKISERDFQYTVLHELTHYRRRDMFYKWLVQITVCLHWFNPFVYLMSLEINKACEFSCDEAIAVDLDPDSLKDYGNTLLDTMVKSSSYKEALASVTLNENKKMLKERLGAIMGYKKKSKQIIFFSMAFTLLFALGATVSGAYSFPSNELLPQSLKQEKADDRITAQQADEMALALTDKMWVWDWVEFFVPYMSDEGVLNILPVSKSAEWAGMKNWKTKEMLQFTEDQIKLARSQKTEKAFLTKADIDAHALKIINANGRLDCIDFMFPYMTLKGISEAQNVYRSKKGYQIRDIDADSIASAILKNAKSWDCIGILWPYLSQQMKDICTQKAKDSGMTIDSDYISAWSRIPNDGNDGLTAKDIDLGVTYYLDQYGWVPGLEYLIPYMSGETQYYDNTQNEADERGISIMEGCGTWGETIEQVLPFMSSGAIENMLIIYLDRHIFAGITTSDDAIEVEQTIQVAYAYMTEESVNRVKEHIKYLLAS